MSESIRIPGDGAALKAALDMAALDPDAVILAKMNGTWRCVRWMEDGSLRPDGESVYAPLRPFDPARVCGVFAEPGGFRLLFGEGELKEGVSIPIRFVRTDGRPFETGSPYAILKSLAGETVLYRLRGPAGTDTPCGLEWDVGRVEVAEPGEPAAHAVVSLTTGKRTALKGGAARDCLNPNLYLAETDRDGVAAEIRL